jgi:hypothetical protein
MHNSVGTSRIARGRLRGDKIVISFMTFGIVVANRDGIQAGFKSLLHQIFQNVCDLVGPWPTHTNLLEVIRDEALLLNGVV